MCIVAEKQAGKMNYNSLNIINTFIHIWVSSHNVLTKEDYAGIRYSHGIHGNTSIVSIVLFWDIEKDEHWLFSLFLDLNPV